MSNPSSTHPIQTIPLVDLKAQYAAIGPDVDAAMQRVLQNTSFIMGAEVSRFEEAFAAFCQAEFCVGVGSGTCALELTLRALEIGPGDEVITVAHTFIATAEAISTVGAIPVFVDIDPLTYTLDPARLADAITPRTRAIMPVHLYGQPADMDALRALAAAHNLYLIEDAAQAHGATWRGQSTGLLGDAACFSFYPGKNLGAYGDAGAVVTNNAELAKNVAMLRNHGRTGKYLHEIKGFGHRIDALQAAILAAKLPYLAQWNSARQHLAARYTELLQPLCRSARPLMLPHVADHAVPVWHLYVICTPARDELLDHLRQRGVEASIHYPIPLHLQPAYAELGYKPGDLPVTEGVANQCLSLPIYPEMTPGQQDYVVEQIADFFAQTTVAEPSLAHIA
ncbi:MAG: DegT/DnrJ/EryC1/StrS family aminotransferase [Caldilineaceae bacterium]|nr:DegT/DnrJ/EryC1/StrS family aminotransferase [Caldilineaceae bacterium]